MKIVVTQILLYLVGQERQPPSMKNWIRTLKGLRRVWFNLKKIGFRYIDPRGFNQDPLKNFFGSIRANGARSNDPTPSGFRGAFKTTLLNNFMSSYSVGTNCEEDFSVGTLQSVKELVEAGKKKRFAPRSFKTEYFKTQVGTFKFFTTPDIVISTHSYIAGCVAKRLLQSANDCHDCKLNILSREVDIDEYHQLIELKEYSSERRSLLYPMRAFTDVFGRMTNVADFFLPRFCLENGVSKLLRDEILKYVDNSFLNCAEHGKNIFDLFVKTFVTMFINQWIKEVNLILKGLRTYSGKDPVKKIASDYHKKFRVKNLSINKFKERREDSA